MKQGGLRAREKSPLTHVSSWLQGVPGNTGLPGQPGLTAELVGTSLGHRTAPSLPFPGLRWPCQLP